MNSKPPRQDDSALTTRVLALAEIAAEELSKGPTTAPREVLVAAQEPLETLLLEALVDRAGSNVIAKRLGHHEGRLSDDQTVLLALPTDLLTAARSLDAASDAIQLLTLADRGLTPDLRPLLENGWRFRKPQLRAGDQLLRRGTRGPYRVRPYRAGDEVEILELFRSAFNVIRDPDHWFWKYRDQPYGRECVSLVFDESGQLVGQYCAYPVPFEMEGGGSHTVHQVGDTMTSPEVRGVGRGHSSILATIAEHFYSSFCRGRVSFNYGFNTGNIQRFSTSFVGALSVEDVHFRRLQGSQLKKSPGVVERLTSALGGNPAVREIQNFDERFDTFFAEARPHYGSLVRRDRIYLDWRYAQRPDLRYRILTLERGGRLLGWSVFSRRDRTLVWGDALFVPTATKHLGHLLRTALEAFETEGPIDDVAAWIPERPTWWDRAIVKLGFEAAPEPQALGLVVVPFGENDADGSALAELLATSLYYTCGDSDLF